MKILVISDTHGDTNKAEEVIKTNGKADMVIHLGDYFRDAQKLAGLFPDIRFEYIYGNSDFLVDNVPAEKVLELCGKRIFITHGHRYSVKWDYSKLFKKAEELNADIVLFGHTHVPDMVKNGKHCILNPGSTSEPRCNRDGSYAIVEIENGILTPRICYI
ncbi:MAG: metallophosphoesterase [Bacillota bacterium]